LLTPPFADVEKDGVDYITGHAKFLDKNTITVVPTYPESKAHGGSDVERQFTADRFVVAVGGTPTLPKDIPGYDLGFHSDGFFYLEELPKRAVIVGAGYIAIELAGVLHTLGAPSFALFDRTLADLVARRC
jgi:glutathione reductase (NADPH)